MKIENLIQTCGACPSQWEFDTDNGHKVYVRYRWGNLTIEITDLDPEVMIFSEQIGEQFDGVLDWSEVERRIRNLDVETAITEAMKEDVNHQARFMSDAAYRRECWKSGLIEMNEYIVGLTANALKMRDEGWKLPVSENPAKPMTEVEMAVRLDKYESEYQAGTHVDVPTMRLILKI